MIMKHSFSRRSAMFMSLAMLLILALVGGIFQGCTSGPYTGSNNGGGARYSVAGGVGGNGAPEVPGMLPALNEELWVIEKADGAAPANDDQPGTGALMAKVPDVETAVACPLKHTDVKASVNGYIATVDVTQQYQNPFDTKIEAVYVFPLPHNAAINEFVMTIGDRKIRGLIREREEAQRIYNEARSQGYVASLLTQDRPNIFTQAVANIEPGKQIDVSIRYYNTLAYDDGWYEFAFPMVVAPRYNPAGKADGIGAVGRGAAGVSGQSKEVQYLRPTERSGHDIGLTLQLHAGVKIEKIESTNHRVSVVEHGPTSRTITLDASDTIPNKDFVLRFKVAGEQVKTALVTHKGKDGNYFALMILPPADLKNLPRRPLEMVFTLDVSGSMSGEPMNQSLAAMNYAMNHMDERDTFQIVRFAGSADQFVDRPVPVTPENIRRARAYLQSSQAGGGTEMLEGLRRSLDGQVDESRMRVVAFLTDGQIGNETDILANLHRMLGSSRVFSFGVGSSTNRYLMEHMAKLGRGAVAYLGLKDSGDDVMSRYFERLAHPALTDLRLEFAGTQVSDVYPQQLPDLFVGRPVIITGKYVGNVPPVIRLRGNAGGESRTLTIATEKGSVGECKALPCIWARMKLADLCDRAAYEPNDQLPAMVKQTALQYGLMSPYTAFLAVDASTRTSGDHGVSVPVPVPVPDGQRYDTQVQEKDRRGEGR
jgi:Ca-activated chloride channel homolog